MTTHDQDSNDRPEREVAKDVELEDVGPHQRLLPDVCEFARREGGNAHIGHEDVGEPHHAYPEERDAHEGKDAADGKHSKGDHATLTTVHRHEVTHGPQRIEHCKTAEIQPQRRHIVQSGDHRPRHYLRGSHQKHEEHLGGSVR
eukprot:scaffold40_cov66-Phaeocystis_antarctica.AAC.9